MISLYLRDSESLDDDDQYLEVVTKVCRSWRTAALANRRLWSRILIDLQGYPYRGDYEMRKSRLQRYLQRSVAVPLSVEITLKADNWPPDDRVSKKRIKTLIALTSQELSRWESLSIDFQDEETVHKFIRRAWNDEPIDSLEPFLSSPMPGLRRLSLCGVYTSFEDLLPHVPLLNAFEAKGGYSTELTIPWSSLTSFRYSPTELGIDSDLLEQLSQCIQLKDLYIEGICDAYELEPAFDCTLPHVVSFHLDSGPSREPINTILANVRFPSLQNLTLVVPYAFWERSEESSVPPHSVGFAGTCKTLTLLRADESHDDWDRPSSRHTNLRSAIFDMFNAMPDLEELRMSEEISEVFLKVIKEEEDLVPKLSRVFILDTGGVEAPLTLDELASRWQRGENRKTKEDHSRYVLG